MTTDIQVTSRKIVAILVCVILFLLTANLTVIYLHYAHGFKYLRGFLHAFYFDNEANFPSLYSASVIALCSVLLWLIGRTDYVRRQRQSLYWNFLAVVFLFLSVDELTSIHEFLIKPVKSVLDQTEIDSNYLYFGWFIPYVFFAILVAFIFLRVLLKLPVKTRMLFVSGGIVFLSGAVVMEMIGGKYWAEAGWNVDGTDPVDVKYALIVTVEEFLEMAGMVLFVYGLSGYYFQIKTEERLVVSFSDRSHRSHSTGNVRAHPPD